MPTRLGSLFNASNRLKLTNFQSNALIALIAALLFIPFLGGVHLFDWDEINFAESAREMIKSGNYFNVQINFIPFWEKPPLFIWMQVLSMKAFGINEFAARFPNAICGIVSLLVLFNIGRKIADNQFAWWWVFFYACSILPFFYFKTGIIDPWFNLFIFIGLYQLYLYFNRSDRKMLHSGLSAFFTGLGILTKGPVALLVVMLAAGFIVLIKKFKVSIRFRDVLIFLCVLAITGGFWFILLIFNGNIHVIQDFMVYQIRLFRTKDAGHGGFLLYHFVILFFGVFPASFFALPSLFKSGIKENTKAEIHLWMCVLFWVVLILFTIVKTKIVHYSSLCYFPLTFLAAWSVYHRRSFSKPWNSITVLFVSVIGLLLALLVIALTYIDHYKGWILSHHWIKNAYSTASLAVNGEWKGFESIAGFVLVIGIVIFIIAWRKKMFDRAVKVLMIAMPVFLMVAMIFIVPRVETYSQRALIDFFSSVSDEDAYLGTIGFKSYAHLFYGQIKNNRDDRARDTHWLLDGEIDKPAYFAVRIDKSEKVLQEHQDLKVMYEKNGYIFLKRLPQKNDQ
jgi:hypothetical protein